jgi:ribonuclease BN (tRNA processing enzyme)
MIRVVTVGTGTAAPHPSRVQSATVVEAGDVRLLIDCGSGSVWRMAALGVPWDLFTHVALSHFHADHTADLATLLFAWRYGLMKRRTTPATLIGPRGTARLLELHAHAMGDSLLHALPSLGVVEVSPGAELALSADCTLTAWKVPHTDESVAYSLRKGETRIVVTGDTGFDPGLGEWAVGSDLLLCECSLPDTLAIPSHLTPRACGRIAALANPGLLALTHFYSPVEREDITGQVREHYDGPLALCHDGWELTL